MGLIERAIRRGLGAVAGQPPAEPAPAGANGAAGPRLVVVDGDRIAREKAAARDTGLPAGPSAAGPRRLHIDTTTLKNRWYRNADGERNTLSRDLQEIKRPLLNKALGRGMPALPNGRRIMVTSAMPSEGKTYTAINLALSIAAERDHGVLLVDADVARPSVMRELGLDGSREYGLIDWLDDPGSDVADLVRPTNIKRFSVLPAGRQHSRATELLSGDSMRRLLDLLTERYTEHVIVFDSPPLMVTSESSALAAHMGQIVMVVAAGQTSRDLVMQALAKLDSAPISGLVLNKVSTSRKAGYYGYY